MKKTLSIFLILTLITSVSFAPTISRAAETGGGGTQTGGGSEDGIDESDGVNGSGATPDNGGSTGTTDSNGVTKPSSNSEASTQGSAPTTKTQTGSAASAAGGAVSCAAGQLIASVLVGAIKSAVTSAVKGVIGTVVGSSATPGAPAVPVEVSKGDVKDNSNIDTAAHTGMSAPGGIFAGISWDAIAFCIGNALIQYIGNSVLNWINTGFKGNPAFVANPQQFFQDIASQTASDFVTTIGGAAGQAIGQGIAGFQQAITKDLVSTFNSSIGVTSQMTLGQYTSDPQGFMNGSSNASLGGYLGVAMGAGNSYGSALQTARNAFNSSVANGVDQANRAYTVNNGYKNVTNCQTNPNGTQGPCTTTVPGSDTQKAGQDARNLSNLRLVAAQKFDQVITALVNEMIKVALNKLFTVGSGSSSH